MAESEILAKVTNLKKVINTLIGYEDINQDIKRDLETMKIRLEDEESRLLNCYEDFEAAWEEFKQWTDNENYSHEPISKDGKKFERANYFFQKEMSNFANILSQQMTKMLEQLPFVLGLEKFDKDMGEMAEMPEPEPEIEKEVTSPFDDLFKEFGEKKEEAKDEEKKE
jgi:hypothetical protein